MKSMPIKRDFFGKNRQVGPYLLRYGPIYLPRAGPF
jgi:hypothetical protein